MTLQILWVIDGLGPGGAENLMPPLLQALSSRGVRSRVCVFQSRNGNPVALELQKRGITVDLVRVDNLRSFGQWFEFIRYVGKVKPDVIHTQLETSDILGNLASRLLGVPSVSTMHTLSMPSSRKTSGMRKRIRMFCLRHFCGRVIAVSSATRQHFIGLGVRPDKLISIYNGIDLDRFNVERTAGHRGRLIPDARPDELLLLTVAVLREAKGIQHMLRALPAILDKAPNARYVIVGDGEYRKPLEDLANALSVRKNISFLGYREEIPELLSIGDLFVFPTLNDALPTVLMESLAVGLPVVASEVGGVPEIVRHDYNGLLVKPGDPGALADACVRALTDRELNLRLRANGKNDAHARFDVRRQAESLERLYRQLAEQRGTGKSK